MKNCTNCKKIPIKCNHWTTEMNYFSLENCKGWEKEPQIKSAEEIIIEEVGEFWWICGKHKPEFLSAMEKYANQLKK